MPSEATRDRALERPEGALEHTEGALESTEGALHQLRARITAFHGAVNAAAREVSEELERRSREEELKGEQALIELGPFGAGRIDPDRFAQLLGVAEAPLTPAALDVLARANSILSAFPDDPGRHLVDVEAGGDLRDVVKETLAAFGRAYGAARAVEMARAGAFDETKHQHLLGRLPYRLWHRAERQLAPPLVVRVRGEDCVPVGLGEFLDGNLVLVLVAEGPTTPAPLARLITPGTFVMQTADPEALGRLGELEHPAVVLLFDEDRPEQAHFVHDPDGGQTTWQRMTLHRMPSEADVGRGRRVPMWVEELDHLRSLAEAPAQPPAPAQPEAAAEPSVDGGVRTDPGSTPAETADAGSPSRQETDPVDRLAAWLLSQAHLDAPAGSPPEASEEG